MPINEHYHAFPTIDFLPCQMVKMVEMFHLARNVALEEKSP